MISTGSSGLMEKHGKSWYSINGGQKRWTLPLIRKGKPPLMDSLERINIRLLRAIKSGAVLSCWTIQNKVELPTRLSFLLIIPFLITSALPLQNRIVFAKVRSLG